MANLQFRYVNQTVTMISARDASASEKCLKDPTLHLHYIYNTFSLHLHCIYITFTLHFHCIYIAFTLHLHCIYITFTLQIDGASSRSIERYFLPSIWGKGDCKAIEALEDVSAFVLLVSIFYEEKNQQLLLIFMCLVIDLIILETVRSSSG